MSTTKTCSCCKKLRNIKLHFNTGATVCKECVSQRYYDRQALEKEATTQQIIQQHLHLY